MPYVAILHTHVTSWAVLLLLFLISFALFKMGNRKGQKITHMMVRLFYILVLVTGISLVFQLGFVVSVIIKAVLAIWLLFLMEMILVKSVKGTLVDKKATYYWLQFVVALAAVLYYGYFVI